MSIMVLTVLAVVAGVLAAPAQAAGRDDRGRDRTVRFATYNASLNRAAAGQLVSDLSTPDNTQARNIAEVLQRVRPDVVLLNEFDYVENYRAVDLFRDNYLERSQQGARADPLPVRVHRAVEHRDSHRLRPGPQRHRRRRQRRVRVR